MSTTSDGGQESANRLAHAFDAAAHSVPSDVRNVVRDSADKIKRDAQSRIRGLGRGHAKKYWYSISFETHATLTGATAEIGPDKDKKKLQAPLGNLLEYGSIKNSPHPHLGPALDAERAPFIRAIEQMTDRIGREITG
jgi:hypothetical protein